MVKLDIKVEEDMDDQIERYAAFKKINKSEAARQLLAHGIDVTSNESEIIKEIKSLKADLRDVRTEMKNQTERKVKLLVRILKHILAVWHLGLIQIFFRGKDKGLTDQECIKSREEAMSTAVSYATKELHEKKNTEG